MNRITSVDAFRGLAIIAVVIIHTTPFEDPVVRSGLTIDAATLIDQLSRFGVPLFFIFSGYFWAAKIAQMNLVWTPTIKNMMRLFFLFWVWSLIYLLPAHAKEIAKLKTVGVIDYLFWRISDAIDHPITTLFQGTKVHLWFLVSLLWCFAISALLLSIQRPKSLFFIALILHLVGLAGSAYSSTPLGINVDFNFRNGPFFGLIYFVTGYFLFSKGSLSNQFTTGMVLIVVGYVAQFLEQLSLHHYWNVLMQHDYVISTYPLALGMALVAFSSRTGLPVRHLATMAPAVLGIYLSHLFYVELLKPLDFVYALNPVWEISYPILVLVMGYATTKLFSSISVTKKLVQ